MNLLQNYIPMEVGVMQGFTIIDTQDVTGKRIYIAGPMRGIPEFNFPAFFAAEERLRALGWEPFNPAAADNDHFGADVSKGNETGDEAMAGRDYGFTINDAMDRDCQYLTRKAQAIYMLKGWENSTGARAEHTLAVCLRLDIYYQETI